MMVNAENGQLYIHWGQVESGREVRAQGGHWSTHQKMACSMTWAMHM